MVNYKRYYIYDERLIKYICQSIDKDDYFKQRDGLNLFIILSEYQFSFINYHKLFESICKVDQTNFITNRLLDGLDLISYAILHDIDDRRLLKYFKII